MKTQIRTTKKCLTDTITFGKYKGRTVEELLDEDPDYLIWVDGHVDFFPLEQEIVDAAIEAAVGREYHEELPWWAMLNDEPPY